MPFSTSEWKAAVDFISALSSTDREALSSVLEQDKTMSLGDGVTVEMCRFFDMETERCAIYPVRPLMCRLMGHVEWMPCPIELVERTLPTGEALQAMADYALERRQPAAAWVQETLRGS